MLVLVFVRIEIGVVVGQRRGQLVRRELLEDAEIGPHLLAVADVRLVGDLVAGRGERPQVAGNDRLRGHIDAVRGEVAPRGAPLDPAVPTPVGERAGVAAERQNPQTRPAGEQDGIGVAAGVVAASLDVVGHVHVRVHRYEPGLPNIAVRPDENLVLVRMASRLTCELRRPIGFLNGPGGPERSHGQRVDTRAGSGGRTKRNERPEPSMRGSPGPSLVARAFIAQGGPLIPWPSSLVHRP